MTPDFWHARWQRGEIGWHSETVNRHLTRYWPELSVAPGGRVLVPLAGKSRDMLWLAGLGHGVLGVELSGAAVEQFFVENDLAPERVDLAPLPFMRWTVDELELLSGDFFDLSPQLLLDERGAGIAAVYDRASLIALPPEMRPAYARQLATLLRGAPHAGGAAESLLITLEYDQQRMSGPPFSVTGDEVRSLFEADFSVQRIASFDALAENPRFATRGLNALREEVYRVKLA
jgi:thiopurine S-methyltransferase